MDVASERQLFSEARRKQDELGAFSFAYFSLGKQRKVRPAAGMQCVDVLEIKNEMEAAWLLLKSPSF